MTVGSISRPIVEKIVKANFDRSRMMTDEASYGWAHVIGQSCWQSTPMSLFAALPSTKHQMQGCFYLARCIAQSDVLREMPEDQLIAKP
jgi:hypothetical protein